jgi:hypothetical protein
MYRSDAKLLFTSDNEPRSLQQQDQQVAMHQKKLFRKYSHRTSRRNNKSVPTDNPPLTA